MPMLKASITLKIKPMVAFLCLRAPRYSLHLKGCRIDIAPLQRRILPFGRHGFPRPVRLRYDPPTLRGFQEEVVAMLKFLALIGLLAIVVAAAAGVYFFGGFYSVAASEADPALVDRMLVQGRQASIARRAKDTPPAEDSSAVQAGARAYATRGCVNCHGAPGVEWAKWSEGLRPDPADLKEVSSERQPADLFWVIPH